MSERTYLEPGYRLEIEHGGVIVVGEPMGKGGTALTYHGVELIDGQESVPVLLKELYPNRDGIVRRENGTIIGEKKQAQILYEKLAESVFEEQELGNKIAKLGIPGIYPMKQVVQDPKSGNYYGLFYQCPPSMSLRQFVEKAGDKLSLCGKIRLILSLCRTVEALHETGGYCHNDISGGNVLVLGALLPTDNGQFTDWTALEQGLHVGLIDFACAAKLGWNGEAVISQSDEDMRFYTDGFSAPELYGGDRRRITAAADVYSVTACLWYLLMGMPLETEDGYPVLEKREWDYMLRCLKRHELCALSGDVRAAFGKNPNPVPDDVAEKLIHVLKRGLAEKEDRYDSMEILTEKLNQILALLEGSSVSESVLRERARTAYGKIRHTIRNDYVIRDSMLPLAKSLMEEKERKAGESALLDFFQSGDSVYAVGAGGIGKTTTLFRLAEMIQADEGGPVPVYVELNSLPMWKEESGISPTEYWMGNEKRPMFLEQYLAGIYYGCPGSLTDRNDCVAGAMRRLVEKSGVDGPDFVILLDGLNEMTFSGAEEKRAFMSAVNWYLSNGRNTRLILTSRYDEAYVDSGKIKRVQVTGLTDQSVLSVLLEEKNAGRMMGEEYRRIMDMDRSLNLWKCLRLPLFLTMYCEIENRGEISSAGEILKAYFHEKREYLDGKHGYSERNIGEEKYRGQMFAEGISFDLVRRFTVDIILPEIGFDMADRQVFFVEKTDAMKIVAQCLVKRLPADMAERFGYKVDVEELKNRILNAQPMRILDEICVRMGLLLKSSGGSYFFPHQYYRDYFAATAILSRFSEVIPWAKDSGYVDQALDTMKFLEAKQWPESVLMLCGECLGIHHTAPEFRNGRWSAAGTWDPMFDSMLDLYRRKPENLFMTKLQSRRRKRQEGNRRAQQMWLRMAVGSDMNLDLLAENYSDIRVAHDRNSEINLMEMIRLCRQFQGRADFSGINLSGICLSMGQFEDMIFSHPAGENGIYADITETDIGIRNFTDDSEEENPARTFTVLHPDGSWILVASENGLNTYIEERELFGEEIRPLGLWKKIERAVYREDGRAICLIEESTMSEERTLYIYDRENGQKWSYSLSYTRIYDCRWINDMVVLSVGLGRAWNELAVLHAQIEDGELKVHGIRVESIKQMREPNCKVINQERLFSWAANSAAIIDAKEDLMRVINLDASGFIMEAAVDPKNGDVYLAKSSGKLFFMDGRSGELKLIRESEIFSGVRWMNVADGKLWFCTGSYLYQMNPDDKDIKLIRFIEQPNGGRLDSSHNFEYVTFGGQYGASSEGMVFRMSDGTKIYEIKKKKSVEEYDEDFFAYASPWTAGVRLSILNAKRKIVYHYGLKEDQSMNCVGYMFPEIGDQKVHAIGIDWKQRLLAVCEGEKIRYYDLDTGKHAEPVEDVGLPEAILQWEPEEGVKRQIQIESASFAPGCESMELQIIFRYPDLFPMAGKRARFGWNLVTGEVAVRPFEDEHGVIVMYDYDSGDIIDGMDSGRRVPVYEENEPEEEWFMDDDYYLGFDELDREGQEETSKSSKFMNALAKKAIQFLDGIGSEEIERKKKARVEASLKRPDFYARARQIPFGDGYLVYRGTEVRHYEMGKTEWVEYRPEDIPEILTVGCPGAEYY